MRFLIYVSGLVSLAVAGLGFAMYMQDGSADMLGRALVILCVSEFLDRIAHADIQWEEVDE